MSRETDLARAQLLIEAADLLNEDSENLEKSGEQNISTAQAIQDVSKKIEEMANEEYHKGNNKYGYVYSHLLDILETMSDLTNH